MSSRLSLFAVPRTVPVYPETEAEVRQVIDKLRDDERQWKLTAKILYDDLKAMTALYEAERRKNQLRDSSSAQSRS